MWAFCLYDPDRRILFLARARFDIKPLYYLRAGDFFAFSSEIKPLLLSVPRRAANRRLLFDYLIYSAMEYADETFFQGVKKLPAETYGVYGLEEYRLLIHSWLDWGAAGVPLARSDPPGRFRELFLDSVNLRLRSDVPVGSCLNGGLDSSAIFTAVGALRDDFDSRFATFLAVYSSQPFDESHYIDIMIQRTGFHSLRVSPHAGELARDLDGFLRVMKEPMPICSTYAQHRVMKPRARSGDEGFS